MSETKPNITESGALKEIYDNWALPKLPPEEIVVKLRELLVPALLAAALRDRTQVEEIVVYEELAPLVVTALQEPELPEGVKIEGADLETTKAWFTGFCQGQTVRLASFEQLYIPSPEKYPPEVLFVRVHTQKDREETALQRWGQESGYFEYLSRQPLPVMPNVGELRVLYFLTKSMEFMSLVAQQKIQMASMKPEPFRI